jgi:two-component system KDP operon response regulator KdpE
VQHVAASAALLGPDLRKRVLVVDDEPRLRLVVRRALERDFEVVEAANGREALRTLYEQRPDLVVLDALMPEMDGFEALRRIRELVDTPIIMLTGLDADADVVRALDSGADEYVTKPVRPSTLAARVRAVLRRVGPSPSDGAARLQFDNGRLIIDRAAGRIWVRGAEVDLSPTEYRLLVYLASHSGQVLSPTQILHQVWGSEYEAELGYIKSYIRLVRAKIEENPRQPRYILSRRGLGYMLAP